MDAISNKIYRTKRSFFFFSDMDQLEVIHLHISECVSRPKKLTFYKILFLGKFISFFSFHFISFIFSYPERKIEKQ